MGISAYVHQNATAGYPLKANGCFTILLEDTRHISRCQKQMPVHRREPQGHVTYIFFQTHVEVALVDVEYDNSSLVNICDVSLRLAAMYRHLLLTSGNASGVLQKYCETAVCFEGITSCCIVMNVG